MKTTVKHLSEIISLVNLAGKTPDGKTVELAEAFNLTTSDGKITVGLMNKMGNCWIYLESEGDGTDTIKVPIVVEDIVEKLARFGKDDVIDITKEGETVVVKRSKPLKKFTINAPSFDIPEKLRQPTDLSIVGDNIIQLGKHTFDTHIKTTAEAMLDIIEDAKPFYEKVQDLTFPLTISKDNVTIMIGNKTVGSVNSELQANSITTDKPRTLEFSNGIHNIFNNLKGPVDLWFGESPYMLVLWESGKHKAMYLLQSLTVKK